VKRRKTTNGERLSAETRRICPRDTQKSTEQSARRGWFRKRIISRQLCGNCDETVVDFRKCPKTVTKRNSRSGEVYALNVSCIARYDIYRILYLTKMETENEPTAFLLLRRRRQCRLFRATLERRDGRRRARNGGVAYVEMNKTTRARKANQHYYPPNLYTASFI